MSEEDIINLSGVIMALFRSKDASRDDAMAAMHLAFVMGTELYKQSEELREQVFKHSDRSLRLTVAGCRLEKGLAE